MKDNFTSITVILDKSGSMWSIAEDTIDGFNQFVKEQKENPGEALITLATFSSDFNIESDIIYNCIPLSDVKDLNNKTYVPQGGTALLDAMGAMIEDVGNNLAAMPEDQRPSKVIFLIITDGCENASHIFKASQIKEMVKHQKEKYNWEFVFMGANIDSIAEGNAIGISMHNTMNYSATSEGTKSLYTDISRSMTRYRANAVDPSLGFFEKEKEDKDSK